MRVDIKAPGNIKIKDLAKKDSVLHSMIKKTPNEIDAWIDDNTKTLNEMRNILKKLTKIVIFLLDKELK